jgi:hypothetical protein
VVAACRSSSSGRTADRSGASDLDGEPPPLRSRSAAELEESLQMHATTITPRPAPRRARRLVGALALCAAVSGALVVTAPAGADPAAHKVTLCHATDSATNPYVQITVDEHSIVDGGHGRHEGPVFSPGATAKWGDVIPAFDLGPQAAYGGMNLDPSGQALLDAGCTAPTGAPTTTTTTTSTSTTTSTTTTSTSTTTTTVVNEL